MLSRCFFLDFSVGVGTFFIGLSHVFSFFFFTYTHSEISELVKVTRNAGSEFD